MADNKLYITITDSRNTKNGYSGSVPTKGGNAQGATANKENDEDSALKRYAEHELFHLVKGTATKAVNFSINNIGNFTGNYIQQQEVNEVKQGISGLVSIGFSTLAGAKLGGLPGAIVGFVVGVGSIVVDTVFDDISNRAQNSKNNFEISMLRERVGLNTIYDGSRGTEN